MSESIEKLETFQDLNTFLRKWMSLEDPYIYDFGGIVQLMLACLDNLRKLAVSGELEGIGEYMNRPQREFFVKIADYISSFEYDSSEDLEYDDSEE